MTCVSGRLPTPMSIGRPLALVMRILRLVGIFEAPNGEFGSGDAAQMISREVTLIYLEHFPTFAT